jgi:hypothetical protein
MDYQQEEFFVVSPDHLTAKNALRSVDFIEGLLLLLDQIQWNKPCDKSNPH